MNIKSIYNKQSLNNTINSDMDGQYGITLIIPTDNDNEFINVKGILKEAISFNVDATWSTLGLEGVIDNIMSSNPILAGIDTVLDVTNLASGRSFTNTGLFSKLFYKNSGRLSLSPSFRVFDSNNTGICTAMAIYLTSLCIPSINTSDKSQSFDLSPVGEIGLKVAKKFIEASETAANSVDEEGNPDIVRRAFAGPAKQLGGSIAKGTKEIGESNAYWSNAPSSIGIKIGNWLDVIDVVVTNVSVNFSYECSYAGPLWVDVSLKCETRENLAYDENGDIPRLRMNSTSKRVTLKNNGRTGVGTGFGSSNKR